MRAKTQEQDRVSVPLLIPHIPTPGLEGQSPRSFLPASHAPHWQNTPDPGNRQQIMQDLKNKKKQQDVSPQDLESIPLL